MNPHDEHELLEEVGRAADGIEEAEMKLLEQIQKAHSHGLSLRKIAEAAGMSHEQIRRMVS